MAEVELTFDSGLSIFKSTGPSFWLVIVSPSRDLVEDFLSWFMAIARCERRRLGESGF